MLHRALQNLLTISAPLLSLSRHSLLFPQYMYRQPASKHLTAIEPTSGDQRKSTARCEAFEYHRHHRYSSSPRFPSHKSGIWLTIWLSYGYALSLIWQPRDRAMAARMQGQK